MDEESNEDENLNLAEEWGDYLQSKIKENCNSQSCYEV